MNGWLETQLELQRKAFGVDPANLVFHERAEYVRWNALAAANELHELLDEFQWKPWATQQGYVADRQRVVDEAVDVLHFLGNLLLTVGATDVELAERYGVKVQVNAERQQAAEGYTGQGNVAHPDHGSPGAQEAPPAPTPEPQPQPQPHAPYPDPGPSTVVPQYPLPASEPVSAGAGNGPPPPAQPAQTEPPAQPAPAPESAPEASSQPAPTQTSDGIPVYDDLEAIKAAYQRGEKAAVVIDPADETLTKQNKELLYKAGYQLGNKASVRQRKKEGVAVGTYVQKDESPQPQQPAQPQQAPQQQGEKPAAQHPLEGKTHVDREGRGWRYVDAQGGWQRAEELDQQAQQPAPSPGF